MEENIRNEIIDAYYKYREMIINKYENPKYLKAVIIIAPSAMAELMNIERFIERENDIYFTYLLGVKTPIIIKNDLPENTKFIIRWQSEYERQEKENLLKKFNNMFGNE